MRKSSLIVILFLSGLCHLFFFTAFKPVLSAKYPITFLSYRGRVHLISKMKGTNLDGVQSVRKPHPFTSLERSPLTESDLRANYQRLKSAAFSNGVNKDGFIFSEIRPYFSLNLFRKAEFKERSMPGEYRNSLVEFSYNRVFSFRIPANNSSFESFLTLKNTGEMFQKHVLFKGPVSFDIFISPAGRAISVKDPQRHISSALRSGLVLRLKKDIFLSKGYYYWKNIEIVLK